MTKPLGILIERGIPVPEAFSNSKARRLPWHDMEVGDSFSYPGDQKQHYAYNASQTASARLHPKKFVARMTDGKARIWRVE